MYLLQNSNAGDSMKFISAIKDFRKRINSSKKEKNRALLLIFTTFLILDYLLICFHIGRNPLAVFPSIPSLDKRVNISVFLPSLDGQTLLQESRMVEKNAETEMFITDLINFVIYGSSFENTKETIPVKDLIVRKIWLINDECIVDFRLSYTDKNTNIIENSETNFKNAVEKTILTNVKSVKKVTLVQTGIYNRSLW